MITDALISDADLIRVYGGNHETLDATMRLEHVLALRAIADYAASVAQPRSGARMISLTHRRHRSTDEHQFDEAVWDDGTVMQKIPGELGWRFTYRVSTPEELCPRT